MRNEKENNKIRIEFLTYWMSYNVHIQNGRIIVIDSGVGQGEFNWKIMPLDDELEHRIEEAAEKYRPDDANRMRLVIEAFDEFAEYRPIVRFADTDVWEDGGRYFWSDDDLTKELSQELNANHIGWDETADEYVYFPEGFAADSVPLENYFIS